MQYYASYCNTGKLVQPQRYFVYYYKLYSNLVYIGSKNIQTSRKTFCVHESKDSICVRWGVSCVLLHFTCVLNESFILKGFIVALAIRERELPSERAVQLFTVRICVHGQQCTRAKSFLMATFAMCNISNYNKVMNVVIAGTEL